MDDLEKLNKYLNYMEQGEKEQSKIEGKIEQLKMNLKDKFNCTTIDEIKENLQQMDESAKDVSEQAQTRMKDLEERLNECKI